MTLRKTVIITPVIDGKAQKKIQKDVEKPFEGVLKKFGKAGEIIGASLTIASAAVIMRKVIADIRESFKDGSETLLGVVDRLDKVNDRAGFYGAKTSELGQVERLAGVKGLNQDQFYMVLDRFQDALTTARQENPSSVSQFSTDTLTAFREWQAGLAGMTDIAARNAEITRVLGMRIAGNASEFLTSDLGALSQQLGKGMSESQYQKAAGVQDRIDLTRGRNQLALDKYISNIAGDKFGAAMMPEQRALRRNMKDAGALDSTVAVEAITLGLSDLGKDISVGLAVGAKTSIDQSIKNTKTLVDAIQGKASMNQATSAAIGLAMGVLP
jgi:hypothetical protein